MLRSRCLQWLPSDPIDPPSWNYAELPPVMAVTHISSFVPTLQLSADTETKTGLPLSKCMQGDRQNGLLFCSPLGLCNVCESFDWGSQVGS